MRRQYHSRQVDGRKLIWDVHRLITSIKRLPAFQLPLSKIAELDEQYWFDEKAVVTCRDIAEHAKLIQETDLAHPIILAADGRVMDGMHRVCKALMEGRSTIAVVQFAQNPDPDYIDVDLESLPYEEPL
jgi:hypothetical protein